MYLLTNSSISLFISSQTKDENSTRRNRLALFDHLPRNRYSASVHSIEETNKRLDDVKEKNSEPISLHPATIKLGLLYRKGIHLQSHTHRHSHNILMMCRYNI